MPKLTKNDLRFSIPIVQWCRVFESRKKARPKTRIWHVFQKNHSMSRLSSRQWSSNSWNTSSISLNSDQNKKRKFGSGWDAPRKEIKDHSQRRNESSFKEENLFCYSLSGSSMEAAKIKIDKEEKMKQDKILEKNRVEKRKHEDLEPKILIQLPIDPSEVSHCPSWHAKRLQRVKLATTKPCGKHLIFEA